MLGAIAGDIIGSVYERRNIKKTQFPLFRPPCRFTDDTVQTVTLAESILDGNPYTRLLKSYYRVYPHAGYGMVESSTNGRSPKATRRATALATARQCVSLLSALPLARWKRS